jgi:hypothetical protein
MPGLEIVQLGVGVIEVSGVTDGIVEGPGLGFYIPVGIIGIR